MPPYELRKQNYKKVNSCRRMIDNESQWVISIVVILKRMAKPVVYVPPFCRVSHSFQSNDTLKKKKKRNKSILATLSIRLIPSARYLWSVCNFKRRRVFDSSFFLFRCYFPITLYKRKTNEWEIVDSNVVNKRMNEKNMKIEKKYHFLVKMSKPIMSRILCNWRQRVHSSSTGQSALSLFSIYLSFFVSR